MHFFQALGNRFIAGGDYNAKHHQWGSRLITPKGRQLLQAMVILSLHAISTGQPTYWPTDMQKVPDLIDFCIIKGISRSYFHCESCFELYSDYSPILVTMSSNVKEKTAKCKLHNHKTNWTVFRERIEDSLKAKVTLKNEEDITSAVQFFNACIQVVYTTGYSKIRHKNDSGGYCRIRLHNGDNLERTTGS